MKSRKSINLYNVLPQEFNLIALKARGRLNEIYKIKEKMNNVDCQMDLIHQMKNSDHITNEIYNSINNNKSSEITPKKIKLSKLNKFDVNVAKFVNNKETKLFVKDERIRMSKAMESFQKLNKNYFGVKNNKLSNSVDIDLNKISSNLEKISSSSKRILRPISSKKKIKIKIFQNNNNNELNKINKLNELNNNEKNFQSNNSNETNKIFSSGTSLPRISSISPIKVKKEDDNKLKNFLKNIAENKKESENKISNSIKESSSDSSNSDEESEEKEKHILHPLPKKLMSKRNSVIVGNGSRQYKILNDLKNKKRNSCIGVEQFKMNLNLSNVNEEKSKVEKKEKKEKIGDTSKIQNNAINLLFPDSNDIKKYFVSPAERVKNMYFLNSDRKKIILPKIKV